MADNPRKPENQELAQWTHGQGVRTCIICGETIGAAKGLVNSRLGEHVVKKHGLSAGNTKPKVAEPERVAMFDLKPYEQALGTVQPWVARQLRGG